MNLETVLPRRGAMLRKIATVLIGTSLAEESDKVVRAGLKVARAAQARVVLVHAASPQILYGGAPHVPDVPAAVEARKESLRRRMEGQAHRLGIRPEERAGMVLDIGPAHQMLMETAKTKGASLIVVGAAEAPLLAKLFGSAPRRTSMRSSAASSFGMPSTARSRWFPGRSPGTSRTRSCCASGNGSPTSWSLARTAAAVSSASWWGAWLHESSATAAPTS
jgi:nucleotide-binding universal stress UspA family protein